MKCKPYLSTAAAFTTYSPLDSLAGIESEVEVPRPVPPRHQLRTGRRSPDPPE